MNQALQYVVASSKILVHVLAALCLGGALRASTAAVPTGNCTHVPAGDDTLRSSGQPGFCGGRLVVSQRSEPKTFNPVNAGDADSLRIIHLLNADLVHINRSNFQTEPSLARSWTVSADGRTYTLALRRGLHFSDGSAFDAGDVVFTYETYLNATLHSPQRDLLLISGVPIKVREIDNYTVAFTLPSRYAAGDRIFDEIAILPRHLLEKKAKSGELATVWGVSTDPKQIVGLGPFRLRTFVPGQRVVLERNPFYWKSDAAGQRLPYLDEVVSEVVPNSEAEALRFLSGETDMMSRMTAANFAALRPDEQKRNFRLYDLGAGFEYTFLFFNQNARSSAAEPRLEQKQKWFEQVEFRQAVDQAVDRDSIVRLVYRSHAVPISLPMSPSNSFWFDHSLPQPVRSLSHARETLRKGGFTWSSDGSLRDSQGRPVEFSLLVNTANPQQQEIGVLVQQDLKDLGIRVTLNTLEFRSVLHRIFSSFDYEAAILTMSDNDADPNTEMNVLLSTGSGHVWSLKPQRIPPWQTEIDSLMQKQLTARAPDERKRLFDQVQQIVARNKPAIFLTSPNVLVGAKNEIENFHPAKLPDYTLWNADQLFNRRQQRINAR
jgi:peptide/nickel transport system substrate-binding protein